MTRSFGKVDSFRPKGQRLAKDLSSLKGMYPLHSDGLSTGSLSRSFLLLTFVPPEYTQSFSMTLFFAEHLLLRGNFRSLELSLSGQQCLPHIRGWASVPRIISFGPAVPSTYSRPGFGPLNYFFRASSAFKIFEAGLRSLELSLLGQQRL
jgi:hypothetical protein